MRGHPHETDSRPCCRAAARRLALAAAKTIEMDVNGLVCAFCAQGIEKTMKALPATEAVFVSLEHRIVAVELKDGSDIDDASAAQGDDRLRLHGGRHPSHRRTRSMHIRKRVKRR